LLSLTNSLQNGSCKSFALTTCIYRGINSLLGVDILSETNQHFKKEKNKEVRGNRTTPLTFSEYHTLGVMGARLCQFEMWHSDITQALTSSPASASSDSKSSRFRVSTSRPSSSTTVTKTSSPSASPNRFTVGTPFSGKSSSRRSRNSAPFAPPRTNASSSSLGSSRAFSGADRTV